MPKIAVICIKHISISAVAVTYDEWYGRTSQEPFEKRYERYRQFQIVADYARDTGRDIFVVIDQVLCKDEAAADAYYQRIKEAGGEGVMQRAPYGKYEPNRRSKDVCDTFETSTGQQQAR